jgi:hypothetical protein
MICPRRPAARRCIRHIEAREDDPHRTAADFGFDEDVLTEEGLKTVRE